ncbi:TPA: hypothetical protein DD449_02490 [Candidatus Berkelbacteria bacterium]|uniref:Uncharacterized protein n=1 Tax=Berkelbacteria bacterium GW2011_GWE1_39_12 TaxID=1618337 RepID=A0A0G4B4M7_9BACT|nr:MAG: hypothetical protein UT28_C0001G0142 [Berkelbacteria bacterium GW2011_GWE1_39_12]HBO60525.1 hypothetical protein [Candidatus Berkelbacteria bacterium]
MNILYREDLPLDSNDILSDDILRSPEAERYGEFAVDLTKSCPYKQSLISELYAFALSQQWTWAQLLRAWVTGGLDCPDGKSLTVLFTKFDGEPCSNCNQAYKVCERFSP